MEIKFLINKKGLFENNQPVGEIQHKAFSSETLANLKGTKLRIEKLNWYGSVYYIYDQANQELLGQTKFNFWGSKAEIIIRGQHFLFCTRNFWDSEWAIESEGRDLVRFETKTVGGTISGEEDVELLTLIGFFLIHHKLRRAAV